MLMIQMKSTELSLKQKNQASIHIQKIVSVKQTSPGVVTQCKLHGHEITKEEKLFHNFPLLDASFSNTLTDSLNCSSFLLYRSLGLCFTHISWKISNGVSFLASFS